MILSENTTLTGNGIGNLTDAVSAIVTHEINGQYELMMTYPVTGIHYSELAQNRIIWAEPDNMTAQQAFRIYRITRPLNGIVTVYARHIAYDMSGIIAEPYTASSLQTALSGLASHCVPSCPFTFTTARAVASPFKVSQPTALWSLLGGQQGSFLDVYGGEWAFDNYAATLTSHLGADRGVSVRYGKNMTELEQDLTIEATYVGIYPFWYDEETDTLVTLPEKYISTAGTGSRILILDCSGDFENQPTVAQLRTRAQSYITANNIGEPQISWKVSFAQLAQDPQYADIAALEQVQLGDTIHIFYEPMNLEASSRAVKIEYDVLMKRYRSVTLGRVKQNLATIVAGTSQEIQKAVSASRTAIDRAIENSTDFIKNGTGYMRFIYNDAGDLMEIVSLDNPDINQAQKVWRWNNGGFGFSGSGYNGPYTTAITQDGSIVADFITTGTLNAARIKAGILEDEAGKFSLNLVTGELHIEQLDVVAEKLSNIGGRNYAWAVSEEYHPDNFAIQNCTYTYNPDNNGEYVVTSGATGAYQQIALYKDGGYLLPDELKGAKVIFHADYIGATGQNNPLPIANVRGFDANNTQLWSQSLTPSVLSRTFTIPATTVKIWVMLRVRDSTTRYSGETMTVRGLKLERGTVATDWTPAPEDQAGYADYTAKAQIDVTADEITSTVSRTYQTKADAAVVNLLPSVYYSESVDGDTWTQSGITWTVNPDGSITATGTATGNAFYYINNTDRYAVGPIRLDPNKQHILHGCPSGGDASTYRLAGRFYTASQTPSDLTGAYYADYGSGVVIPSGYTWAIIYSLRIDSGVTVNNLTWYPMLEVGNVAHGYVSTHNGSYAMQAQIKVNAGEISSKVSQTDYNGRTIASLINQTATDASINAQKINLTGYVTASSLTASGTTTIDGSRITTGYISADRINANSIGVGKLTGSITGGLSNSWVINLTNGTMTIGNISAANITTGTLSADRIGSKTITADKISVTDLQALGATIAGWTIGTNELSKSWSGSLLTHTAGINAPSTPSTSDAAFYVSATVGGATTYPFRVNYDGKLIATSAEIEGTITSSNATITGGSVNISTDSRSNNQVSLNYASGGVTRSSQLSAYSGLRLSYSDSSYSDFALVNHSGLHLGYNPDSSDYADYGKTFLIIGDRSAGRVYADKVSISIQDSSFTKLSELTNSGLVFRNASDAVTAQYPAAGWNTTTINSSSTQEAIGTDWTASNIVTYTVPTSGWYILSGYLVYNSGRPRGVMIVRHTSFRQILAVSESTANSFDGKTVSAIFATYAGYLSAGENIVVYGKAATASNNYMSLIVHGPIA